MESFLPLVRENLRSALWFQPEMALTFGTLVLFMIDLLWKKSAARVAYLTAGALAVLGVAAALLARQPADGQALFNGMIANDAFAIFFKWLFLAAGALTVLVASLGKDFPSRRIGEFYARPVARGDEDRARRLDRLRHRRHRLQGRRGALAHVVPGRVRGRSDAVHRVPLGGPEGRRVRARAALLPLRARRPCRQRPRRARSGRSAARART